MTKPSETSPQNKEQAIEQGFVQIKCDGVKWQILWLDPKTDQFWKEYFPHSEWHGGGPSTFVKITEQEARADFGSW